MSFNDWSMYLAGFHSEITVRLSLLRRAHLKWAFAEAARVAIVGDFEPIPEG